MIDFVDTSPFLRIALLVAMATMHSHKAQTGLFMRKFFSHSGGPRDQFCTSSKLSLGARYIKLDPEVDGLRPKSIYF